MLRRGRTQQDATLRAGDAPLLCRAGDEQDARAKLSRLSHDFMPPDKRNTSGAYQGSMYFSFEGKILEDLRKEREG